MISPIEPLMYATKLQEVVEEEGFTVDKIFHIDFGRDIASIFGSRRQDFVRSDPQKGKHNSDLVLSR